MAKFDHQHIEQKWQDIWAKTKLFKTSEDDKKPKKYVLDFFPYPSGEGLHVGHLKGYSATDVYAHLKRRQGYNVLHPMGWDAFGLPAENFAIKKGIHPAITTAKNIELSKSQLTNMGLSYDWEREINTTDPEYFRWTQWIFIKLFEAGLAYEAEMPINWCPSCKTGLANEEVVNGKCERCGTEVTKKNIRQWVLKITAYADRLLNDLDKLDWPAPIKTMQKNWIGRSEGAEVIFKTTDTTGKEHDLPVFTTRADTLFGATFMVLAPEHELVGKLATQGQKKAVDAYIKATANKSDIERQEEGKEKTGVFTGSFAINPVNGAKIPIWIADYVLTDYGHGAIMAVPAHDERDFAFAKKFDLPIKYVVEPSVKTITGDSAYHEGEPDVKREAVCVIVRNPKDDTYMGISWKKVFMHGLVTGGVEAGETFEEAARREVVEETGYKNLKLVREPEIILNTQFHHLTKGVNRWARFHYVVFDLIDDEKSKISPEEEAMHEVLWFKAAELSKFFSVTEGEFIDNLIGNDNYIFTGAGVLGNSGKYDSMTSEEARKKIVEELGKKNLAKNTVNYKLRDWLFSRQRYWGEPIPIVHCDKCGLVPVPDSELPLKLPEVEKYEPTGTGESPLAGIDEWVNTTCPKCGGPGKRETNTMPQWAGSCWYYMRFLDPHNEKAIASDAKLAKWLPVDFYVGGAEHAVLHLLYARFWYKFLHDIKVTPTDEPFQKLRNVGLILAEDGRKMSKSLGNVVNPNEIIAKNGADTLKTYELFMGPFEQTATWSMKGVEGISRFLSRVWNLFDAEITNAEPDLAETVLINRTIKKVTEDIEEFRFNTAISALMVLTNSLVGKKLQNKKSLEMLLMLLAPFAPHIAEELWEKLGNKESIHASGWPTFDEKYLVNDICTVVIQVNGKLRASIEVDKDSTQEEVEKVAMADAKIQKLLGKEKTKKVIYIPGKILNIVI
jgi:leucyl-tRNA synthetase